MAKRNIRKSSHLCLSQQSEDQQRHETNKHSIASSIGKKASEEGKEVAKKLEESGLAFEIVFVPYRPTAEEMSRDIYRKLKADGVAVTEVELFETPTNSCIYTEEYSCSK